MVVDAQKILRTLAPERLAVAGLKALRAQSRRPDLLGTAAYRILELVHGGLQFSVGSLSKIEKASQPPARPRQPARSRKSASAGA